MILSLRTPKKGPLIFGNQRISNIKGTNVDPNNSGALILRPPTQRTPNVCRNRPMERRLGLDLRAEGDFRAEDPRVPLLVEARRFGRPPTPNQRKKQNPHKSSTTSMLQLFGVYCRSAGSPQLTCPRCISSAPEEIRREDSGLRN